MVSFFFLKIFYSQDIILQSPKLLFVRHNTGVARCVAGNQFCMILRHHIRPRTGIQAPGIRTLRHYMSNNSSAIRMHTSHPM